MYLEYIINDTIKQITKSDTNSKQHDSNNTKIETHIKKYETK